MFRIDPELLSFLNQLKLSKLAPIFQQEEISMKVLLKLSNEELKDIGIKLGQRKIILEETKKLRSPSTAEFSKKEDTETLDSMFGTKFGEKYRKDTFIGRGAFGEAWKIRSKQNNGIFILKEISCTQQDLKAGRNEIDMLKQCRHESIVRYVEDFYERSKFLIIMEFCSGGDLAKFIDAQTQLLPADFIIDWVMQLTSGVYFIHKKKIIHRDLKPPNIFLTKDKLLKIGDFGIAKGLDKTSGLASSWAGTSIYMAPEIHGGDKYDRMADMWSLGIVVFEIITLQKPFHGYKWMQEVNKEKL